MLKKGMQIGLLLFGIFFGAGNLIFPPSLGFQAGNQFMPAIIGFIVTGVGMINYMSVIQPLMLKSLSRSETMALSLELRGFGSQQRHSFMSNVQPNAMDYGLIGGMILISAVVIYLRIHERRMEIYFYFEIPKDQAVFHIMGQGQETRHIVMHNEQAVISPSWSIHCGCGTHNYIFIWAMGGENKEFDDMDHIKIKDMK